jgi:hypothetical protein
MAAHPEISQLAVSGVAAAETPSMQVREVKADRRVPGVVVVIDHLGTAAREMFNDRLCSGMIRRPINRP